MDIQKELGLKELSKPIAEMNRAELKANLKNVNANIKKITLGIKLEQSKGQAKDIESQIAKSESKPMTAKPTVAAKSVAKAKAAPKASPTKPVVKSSNRGTGELTPVKK